MIIFITALLVSLSSANSAGKLEISKATLTSVYRKMGAERCIDGKSDTWCHGGKSSGDTLTMKIPSSTVESVTLSNRPNWYGRLNGAVVKVDGRQCGQAIKNARATVKLTCPDGTKGSTITLESKNWLHVTDVVVMGWVGDKPVDADFEILEGGEFCEINNDGCITDGEGKHGALEYCKFVAKKDGVLSVPQFDLEGSISREGQCYDYLLIHTDDSGWPYQYCGSNFDEKPEGVRVETGFVFEFQTDDYYHSEGFTICIRPPSTKRESDVSEGIRENTNSMIFSAFLEDKSVYQKIVLLFALVGAMALIFHAYRGVKSMTCFESYTSIV